MKREQNREKTDRIDSIDGIDSVDGNGKTERIWVKDKQNTKKQKRDSSLTLRMTERDGHTLCLG